MNTTVYYAPDAVGSLASIFSDGTYMYERVHNLGSLGALDGWLKRIGRKLRKGIKKVGKKAFKVMKKVHKVTMKVVRKALPIVSTVLSFVPGVGWAASAALMAAEMGLKAYDKYKSKKDKRKAARKALRKKMAELNAKTTTPAKPVKRVNPIQRVDMAPISQTIKKVQLTPVKPAPPQYTSMDFMRINQAVNRDKVGVDDVIAIVQKQVNQSY